MQAMPKIETVSVKMYPDDRLDTKNAALYLGLEEKTLAMKRSDGTGPCFIKRGRIFYFNPTCYLYAYKNWILNTRIKPITFSANPCGVTA